MVGIRLRSQNDFSFSGKKKESGMFGKFMYLVCIGIGMVIWAYVGPRVSIQQWDDGITVQPIQEAMAAMAAADDSLKHDVVTSASERLIPEESVREEAIAMESLDKDPIAEKTAESLKATLEGHHDKDVDGEEQETANSCNPGAQWIVKRHGLNGRRDTLSGIAKHCWGRYSLWTHLQEKNRGIDPLRLKAVEDHGGKATVLFIPEAPTARPRIARRQMAPQQTVDDARSAPPIELEEPVHSNLSDRIQELSAVDDWDPPDAPDDEAQEE